MKIKVFSAQSYDKEFLSRAAVDLKDLELVFQVEALTKDTVSLASGFDGICLFVNDQLDKDMILNLKERGLKLVLLRCAGFNNVCVETCVANGIRVMRVPTYSPEGERHLLFFVVCFFVTCDFFFFFFFFFLMRDQFNCCLIVQIFFLFF